MKLNSGICFLSTVAVREKPSHKSEMINQLLFGDLFSILDSYDSWSLIESDGDKYQGWVDKAQIKIVSDEFLKKYQSEEPHYLKKTCTEIKYNNTKIVLSQGSRIPLYNNRNFAINEEQGELPPSCTIIKGKQTADAIIRTAYQFLGTPYLWGGRSSFGVDCSGFIQTIFKMNGYQLPRDSKEQAKSGKNIDFIHEALPGDLAFFDNEEQQIIHVGLLLENNQIIHASGHVRIDDIDHEGIYNKEKQKYTHRLRLIKHVL